MRKSKAKSVKTYQSIGQFAEAMGWRDADLARYLGCSLPEANKLRHGKTFRGLMRPLRIARQCRVPIENLAAIDVPESQS